MISNEPASERQTRSTLLPSNQPNVENDDISRNKLESENQSLKVENSSLKVENQSLKAENVKLRFKLELLEQTTLTGDRLKGNDNLLKFYTSNKLNCFFSIILYP